MVPVSAAPDTCASSGAEFNNISADNARANRRVLQFIEFPLHHEPTGKRSLGSAASGAGKRGAALRNQLVPIVESRYQFGANILVLNFCVKGKRELTWRHEGRRGFDESGPFYTNVHYTVPL